MAELQEVIKQYKRMCKNTDCCDCPFFDTRELSYYKTNNPCDSLVLARPEVCEPIIMEWAAEHPEPVFPTWYEYLSDYYRAAFGDMAVIARQPIPADIAQKLGIEPKEA